MPAAIEKRGGVLGEKVLSRATYGKQHEAVQIDRLQVMYPNKKWLAIGDSTQTDRAAPS